MVLRLSAFQLLGSALALQLCTPILATAQIEPAQADSFVAWAARNAIAIHTTALGSTFDDLEPLREVIGSARVVALGEPTHLVHEPLTFRNRLFEFLVREMGFTAIALETGFSEGAEVYHYALGAPGNDTAMSRNAFSWASPTALDENRELIEWIRRYNTTPATPRRIHFYGMDLSGGRYGLVRQPRPSIDAALAYLDVVDSAAARASRQAFEPLLERFNEQVYGTLSSADRNALTATIADLVALLERNRLAYVARTSEPQWAWAHRQAIVARQVDAVLRPLPPGWVPTGEFPSIEPPPTAHIQKSLRDLAMAENVRWILGREGRGGRLLVFAHNSHVHNQPFEHASLAEPVPRMGQHLRSFLGSDLLIVGTTFNRAGKGLNYLPAEPADPTGLDGVLARVGNAHFVVDLRQVPPETPAGRWLAEPRTMRSPLEWVNARAAFDALVFVDTLTPARAFSSPRQ